MHPSARRWAPVAPDWWMDLHGPQNFRKPKGWSQNYLQWLKRLQEPIFMQKDWPDIPMAVEYPKDRILSEFRPYFTNHLAWMIALAMTEGITHIGVFGCEYQHDFERGQQRGSAEYMLGRFEGYGGHVVLPPGSSLLHEPVELYGYESHDEEGHLKPSYLPRALRPKDATPKLVLLDPNTSEGRPPLIKLPDLEAVAWERSGHTIHK